MTNITIKIVTKQKWNPMKTLRAFIFIMALILPGVWLESQAMQWVGFIFLILTLLGYIVISSEKSSGLTIAEARQVLDELQKEEISQ